MDSRRYVESDGHAMMGDILRLMRPRQWTKNLAVFAGIVFVGELTQPLALMRVSAAFVAFCFVASALYAANDVLDADRDRMHPVKRERPVASGRMKPGVALAVSAVLAILGLGISVALGWPFMSVIAGYLVVQLLYVFWLKHIAIVDMLVIAVGFVLRAVGGAVVIAVRVSPWLVLCTGLLALFLAAAKRRHEIVLLTGSGMGHRPVLAEYSAELLDSFMVTLSAATVTSYALYTFFESRVPGYAMMATIPFVIYGVLRYQFLVMQREGGGKPEDILLSDVGIMVAVGLWILTAVALLYALPLVIR
jgi:4-hydroxybenzoate polyprenyltransferase